MLFRDKSDMINFLDETIKNVEIDKLVLSDSSPPAASVIIVTHDVNISVLEEIIDLLKSSTRNSCEILIIENSEKSQLDYLASRPGLTYIKLKRNYGITAARNIGIHYAKGNILIFLDDDAIPGKNFVDEHIRAYQEYNIYALRGKCLPKTKSVYNYFAIHYDLGDNVIHSFIDLEGNSSFKRDILTQVGGFNTNLDGGAGHEGLEISRRVINETKNRDSIIYYPNAVIYHNYSKSLSHYIKKQIRHRNYGKYIYEEFPDFREFYRSYTRTLKTNVDSLDYITKGKIMIITRLTAIFLRLV